MMIVVRWHHRFHWISKSHIRSHMAIGHTIHHSWGLSTIICHAIWLQTSSSPFASSSTYKYEIVEITNTTAIYIPFKFRLSPNVVTWNLSYLRDPSETFPPKPVNTPSALSSLWGLCESRRIGLGEHHGPPMDSVTWVAELCRALKESKFLKNYTFNIPKSHQNTKKYIDMFLKLPFFDFLSLSHLPLSSHPTSIWGSCDLFLAPRSSKDDTQTAVKTLRAKSVTLLARGWIDSEFSMKHLQEVDLGYCGRWIRGLICDTLCREHEFSKTQKL